MQEYETIKRARAILAERSTTPSERTVAGYEAKTRRIVHRAGQGAGIDELSAQAKQTQSAATWFSRRAALMHSFRAAADQLLAQQDTMQRAIKAVQSLGQSPELVVTSDRVKEGYSQIKGKRLTISYDWVYRPINRDKAGGA